MIMMTATLSGWQWSGYYGKHYARVPTISWTKSSSYGQRLSTGILKDSTLLSKASTSIGGLNSCLRDGCARKNRGIHVVSTDISSPNYAYLDAFDDEYEGVIIDPNKLPYSANAFASALRASLSIWKLKGKKGIWLSILLEQADLVPIAIREGFKYHHAEPGYVMLTYWIPDYPCLLPASPSHQIGVGGFVINDKKEVSCKSTIINHYPDKVLAVKEKCPFSCSNVWKMPTGYINKSEDIFSGAIREVKEETGVDTRFLRMVAFRHAHLVAFEKSDILFVCMLMPLTYEITIDEKEIQAAKWMHLDEFVAQPFYEEDHMSKKIIGACIAAYEDHYNGFVAQKLTSKIDGKLSYLYYDSSAC